METTRASAGLELANPGPPAVVDGSRLCLACGLCCQGVLHDHVELAQGEAGAARRLGLRVHQAESGPVFDLPCPHHQGGRCAVYGRRPRTCGAYRCKLLRRYLDGEASWEECSGRVAQVKDLLARLRRRLGSRVGGSIWHQLGTAVPPGAGDAVDPDLLVDVATLATLCKKYFKNRARPRPMTGAAAAKEMPA